MRRVELKDGVSCWCDTLRLDAQVDGGWRKQPTYLSLVGPHNAVRACWARLVGGKGSLSIGEHYVALESPRDYLRLSCPLPERRLHLVLAHQTATSQVSVWAKQFYLYGSDADVFYSRLSRMCVVPMRAEWAAELLRAGLEPVPSPSPHEGEPPVLAAGPVRLLEGFGDPVYSVAADAAAWAKIVSDGLRDGRFPTLYGQRRALLRALWARSEALGV